MVRIYNYLGNEITGTSLKLSKEEYGHYEIDGTLVVDWPDATDERDENGFDKRITEYDGNYKREIILPKGFVICRYGRPFGYYSTEIGTPYERLGLPYDKTTIEYHQYEVSTDGLSVIMIVTAGIVAPVFDSNGGATQFLHMRAISDDMIDGRLREVTSWR